MYPNLYYFFKDVFGLELTGLKIVNSFGFFVALAFLSAAWLLTKELQRKQKLGLLAYTEQTITVGAPASTTELLINFLLGFVFGFKLIGVFVIPDALNDPQSFILSSNGSVAAGILVGGIFAGLKWYEFHKQKLAKPEQRVIRIWPSDRVGDLVIYAAVFGFAGAKVFHNLENWNDFVRNPIDALISFSGLTFYGGLICAGVAIILYAKKNKIAPLHLADAIAPALMMAYAIGRIGCQVAGDGDWGILNSAFVSSPDGSIIAATQQDFANAIHNNATYYMQQFGNVTAIPHKAVQPILGLPNWLFAYNYPHNVIGEGVRIAGCTGNYCAQLPIAVFPTPFYETLMALCLFGILWLLRKKITAPGQLFGLYLLVNGAERFTIEQIRVNTKYMSLPFQPTQAELIALVLMIGGAVLVYLSKKWTSTTR